MDYRFEITKEENKTMNSAKKTGWIKKGNINIFRTVMADNPTGGKMFKITRLERVFQNKKSAESFYGRGNVTKITMEITES